MSTRSKLIIIIIIMMMMMMIIIIISKMSLTSSERPMYVEFKSCVQRVVFLKI